MQGNLDKALQYEHLSSEGRFVELDEPGAACIASIDNDNTGDPQRSTMDKTNSLGKMFQRLRSSSKKYHINNASTIGELDESIASPDSIEGIPKFSQLEKTNSLGKIFQRMRSSDKKVQQKRPSSAVCDSSSKGLFSNVLLYSFALLILDMF